MHSKNQPLKKSLLELASNKQFIPGICNYCDRWCARCPKTQNCLSFAYGQEIKGISFDENDHDTNNKMFWNTFDQSSEITGINLTSADANSIEQEDSNLNLEEFAKEYGEEITSWLTDQTEIFQSNANQILLKYGDNHSITFSTVEEILRWYSLFIASKIERALKEVDTRTDRNLEDKFNPYRDNLGSSKIAIIACNRSMTALSLIYEKLENEKSEIVKLYIHLSKIKNQILKIFPDSMQFIRPGFDS